MLNNIDKNSSNNLEKTAFLWVTEEVSEIEENLDNNYFSNRASFKTQLIKMEQDLLKSKKISEEKVYILTAIVGEIGNNSFDHNIGNWPDIMGIFFGYQFIENELYIILADRGQGVLKTLQRVKPELENDEQALETAFNEKISGRAPEARGNGLKFVKNSAFSENIHLDFYSGRAKAEINEKLVIKESLKLIKGCLVVISI